MTPIVLRRGVTMSIVATFIGAVFLAVVLLPLPLAARVFFGVLGGTLFLSGVKELVLRAPRLRADADGVWFGGGSTIPWSEVASVFVPVVMVKGRQTSAIAFELRAKSTLLRTPFRYWILSAFSVGDIDIATRDLTERAEVVAAKLDALREAASGQQRVQ